MEMTIDTLSGLRHLQMIKVNGEVKMATVDMGKAELRPEHIPVLLAGDKIVSHPIAVGGKEYAITCVSMGNPHCVVFGENPDILELDKIGPMFEYNELFPERINTEFIQVINRNTLKMRVWERGSGETWACGTGACAAAVAAVENGFCDKNTDITVKLRGGELIIRYTDDTVYLTGGTETVYEGVVEI
jgi:carbamoyl-phosphate synthase large subunit